MCTSFCQFVITLTLGSWPRHGFARGWAKKGTRECERVWESTLTLLSKLPCWELDSRWTPSGLLKLQREISKSKTLFLVDFFIPLKIYWKVDVQNGLAWPIWTFETQVMAKRKAGSQIASLTPNHGKSKFDPIPLRASGVQHAIGKLSTKATTSV
jgi:hypothetical protein